MIQIASMYLNKTKKKLLPLDGGLELEVVH